MRASLALNTARAITNSHGYDYGLPAFNVQRGPVKSAARGNR